MCNLLNGTVLVSSDGTIKHRRSQVCSQTPSGGQNTLPSIRVRLIRRIHTCNNGETGGNPDDLLSERLFTFVVWLIFYQRFVAINYFNTLSIIFYTLVCLLIVFDGVPLLSSVLQESIILPNNSPFVESAYSELDIQCSHHLFWFGVFACVRPCARPDFVCPGRYFLILVQILTYMRQCCAQE